MVSETLSSSSGGDAWSTSSAVLLCVILVPLVVVSLVALAVDSGGPTYWPYFSPSLLGGGGGGDAAGGGGGGRVVSGKVQEVVFKDRVITSLPPVEAPSPAPAKQVDSELKNANSVQRSRSDIMLEKLELGLAKARAAIREAAQNRSQISRIPDEDYVPQGPVYRNAYAFHRSYLEMEKLLRVYVYEEGEPPLFHDGPCKSIYSTEGRFIYNIEMENRLRTTDPDRAIVHFLPFSVAYMIRYVYTDKSYDLSPVKRTIEDYINTVAQKYPYWNRSLGADHFMLSCHDWGPHSSHATPNLYSNSIRVLCNANTSEGFDPSKDVTLPEINLVTGVNAGIFDGPSLSGRPFLAFFAGGVHGPIRPVLLEHWKGKDADLQVYEYLPKGTSYYDMMRKSKFCLCPSGYEVASPRVVEAIYLDCVPVLISDHYVPPFSDVLNWDSFSIRVSVAEIPDLKRILSAVSWRQYVRMQRRVRMVRRHFVENTPPERFDVFHMILHSVWLRRLNVRVH